MIYLDTHIVVWLYAGLLEKFSPLIQSILNENELMISPIVQLELAYLHEIQRVNVPSSEIVTYLSDRIGLQVCTMEFNTIVLHAIQCAWTRDPFDRIIVANAALAEKKLVTKDTNILQHYPLAIR